MPKNLTAYLLTSVLSLMVPGQGKTSHKPVGADYQIAFAAFAQLNIDIFVADADGRNAKPLLAHPDQDYNASSLVMGNGSCFRRSGMARRTFTESTRDGTGLARLTEDPAFDDQGALSPDGKYLAFVSSRTKEADIWVLELALKNLTSGAGNNGFPSWAPDGRRNILVAPLPLFSLSPIEWDSIRKFFSELMKLLWQAL